MGSRQEDGLNQHSGEISLDPENHHIIEEDIIFQRVRCKTGRGGGG
jgi:hypothetical protein